MRARDGHWVGFDPELDSHHIYCADRGTVGIEQSVVFEKQLDVAISTSVNAQPVGERENSLNGSNREPNIEIADANTPSNKPDQEVSQHMKSAEDAPNYLGNAFEPPPPEPMLCQLMCQCFESKYFKWLNTGEGMTDGQTTHPNKSAKAAIEDLFEGTTHTGKCPDDSTNVFTMVAGVAEAEALDPSMVDEVRLRSDWGKWETAIKSELKSLDDMQTWRIVERLSGMNIVRCKWVFKIKQNAVGEIDKYKA